MDWTLEVVVLPVSDIDRSIAFYRDKVGFALDHDTVTPQMHVTQLTPPGSGCSIVFGDGPGMDGKPTKYKSVSHMPDDDTIHFSMYMGDGKDPAFTIVYKRKK